MAVASGAGGYVHPLPSTEIVGGEREVSLAESYELCRQLNAAHGRTYYFATRFLPPDRRPHVHALYGFARYADDMVDHLALTWTVEERRSALEAWSAEVLRSLDAGQSEHPVLKAVVHTVTALRIERDDLEAFLTSMAMDLWVTRYRTFADLAVYVHGSAAVIGAMMLPVLGTVTPEARARAMDLGVAFQLTNFLRDIAEDYDRGRIYLPLEDLERFGVEDWDFRSRHVGPAFRRLLAFEVARARVLYERAEEGWALLPPRSQRCIRIAHRLYAGILDVVEADGYQVFRRRAAVPLPRKLGVALRETLRPARTAEGGGRGTPPSLRQNGRPESEVPRWVPRDRELDPCAPPLRDGAARQIDVTSSTALATDSRARQLDTDESE